MQVEGGERFAVGIQRNAAVLGAQIERNVLPRGEHDAHGARAVVAEIEVDIPLEEAVLPVDIPLEEAVLPVDMLDDRQCAVLFGDFDLRTFFIPLVQAHGVVDVYGFRRFGVFDGDCRIGIFDVNRGHGARRVVRFLGIAHGVEDGEIPAARRHAADEYRQPRHEQDCAEYDKSFYKGSAFAHISSPPFCRGRLCPSARISYRRR